MSKIGRIDGKALVASLLARKAAAVRGGQPPVQAKLGGTLLSLRMSGPPNEAVIQFRAATRVKIIVNGTTVNSTEFELRDVREKEGWNVPFMICNPKNPSVEFKGIHAEALLPITIGRSTNDVQRMLHLPPNFPPHAFSVQHITNGTLEVKCLSEDVEVIIQIQLKEAPAISDAERGETTIKNIGRLRKLLSGIATCGLTIWASPGQNPTLSLKISPRGEVLGIEGSSSRPFDLDPEVDEDGYFHASVEILPGGKGRITDYGCTDPFQIFATGQIPPSLIEIVQTSMQAAFG